MRQGQYPAVADSSQGVIWRLTFYVSGRRLRMQQRSCFDVYCILSQLATAFGQNLTDVPMRNDGIRPAFACLKIVIRETDNNFARSSAVRAWPVRSICSISVMDVSEDGMVLPKQLDLCFAWGPLEDG